MMPNAIDVSERQAMRISRFRIRNFVIAVLVLSALIVAARAYALRRKADRYAASARYWTWQAENAGDFSRSMRDVTEAEYRDGCLRRVQWYLQMRDKYLRSSFRPWLRVDPDPPLPR